MLLLLLTENFRCLTEAKVEVENVEKKGRQLREKI